MEYLAQYGLFLAKSVTWVVAILAVLLTLIAALRSAREHPAERLEVKNVNERLRQTAEQLNDELMDETARKLTAKARKKDEKARRKADKLGKPQRPRLFVLSFHGDIQASAVVNLREEVSAVLQVARSEDEILVRLESAGGLVHAYGLAASQLSRLRQHGLQLTVAVDKVAASGGYMMACVADRILAAPFAVIGSIGVVAQLPNVHRLLKKHDIDIELHTAGPYKRTLTVLGENTEEGRAKFREELEETHTLFKSFVRDNRPVVDIDTVATGEHWYGSRALELKLIDRIATSDDYLLERLRDADVYEIRFRRKPKVSERLAHGLARLADALRGQLSPADTRLM